MKKNDKSCGNQFLEHIRQTEQGIWNEKCGKHKLEYLQFFNILNQYLENICCTRTFSVHNKNKKNRDRLSVGLVGKKLQIFFLFFFFFFGLEGFWEQQCWLYPWLLYSNTHHSPESFTHLKTGWAQDAWLQRSCENWYFHLDISRWHKYILVNLQKTFKLLHLGQFTS